TGGELQPIFLDGATSANTGLTNATGLAFSTLDQNLFQITPETSILNNCERQQDSGHGINESFDMARPEIAPSNRRFPEYQRPVTQQNYGSSYQFGRGRIVADDCGEDTYDFPGGAYGTLVSNEFSLDGYSSADRPVLYFNYYLDTENANALLTEPPPRMRDSFRVFISDNDGNWQLLATNNSDVGPDPRDDELLDIGPFDVQELFDVGDNGAPDSWRQVRVALDPYAGRENLRLRFDFSSAGEMNLGDRLTTGEELRAVAGVYINDGDTFQVDNRIIEFDSGYTLVAPSGTTIAPRETLSITDEDGQTVVFEFVDSNDFPTGIVAPDGSSLGELDTFSVSDGTNTATFELDSGLLMQVPDSSRLTDGETFFINNGVGSGNVVFEFDKDGAAQAAGVLVQIPDDLTIVVPADGSLRLIDGDRFSIDDGTGTVVFELDRNGAVSGTAVGINIASHQQLQVPASGGGFAGIQDGDFFTIDGDVNDLNPPIVFEFDSDGTSTGDVTISLGTFTTQDVLAQRIVAAIGSAGFGLSPVNLGNGTIQLNGITPLHRVDATGSTALTQRVVPLSRDDVSDRIVSAVQGAGVGVVPVNTGGGRVVLQDTTPSHVLNTGGSLVLAQTTTPKSPDDVAGRMVNAIQTALPGNNVTARDLGGGVIHVRGILSHATNVVNSNLSRSDRLPFVLQAPATGLHLIVPPSGGAGVADGQTFTLTNEFGTSRTFEFDADPNPGSITPGNDRIPFSSALNQDNLALGIVQAIFNSGLGVSPAYLGSGDIDLRTVNHSLDVANAPNLAQTGIADRQAFTVTEGAGTVTFEFDAGGGVSGSNRPVPFTAGQSADELADAIVAAIARAVAGNPPALTGLNPGTMGGGLLSLGGTIGTSHTLDTSGTANLTQSGTPGVDPAREALAFLPTDTPEEVAIRVAEAINVSSTINADATVVGDIIQLGVGTTFNPGNSALLPQGNIPIFISPVDTPADVAERIALAIQLSPLGNSVTSYFNNHENIDAHRLNLEGAANVIVSPGAAPFLLVEGGVGVSGSNVPVEINSGMSRVQVADVLDELFETLFFDPRLITQNGLQYLDGDLFVLEDNVNAPLSFEFDSGFLLQVPPAGGEETLGGLQDGVTFSIDDPNDGLLPATFEFDKDHLTNLANNPTVAPGNTPILISDGTGPVAIARAIAAAVQNHPMRLSLQLTPRVMEGGLVQIGGRAGEVLTITPGSGLTREATLPRIIEIPEAGGNTSQGGVRDGATVTITDGINTLTYEFDKNFSVTSGNRRVGISETSTPTQVANALVQAIGSSPAAVRNALGISIVDTTVMPGGDRVRVGGIPTARVETSPEHSNVRLRRFSEPGVDPALSLMVPETLSIHLPEALRIHVPVVGGRVGGVVDGDTFSLDDDTNDTNPPLIFEFDSDGSVGVDPNGTPHLPVFFGSTDNADDIALSIREAISNTTLLGVVATKKGGIGNIDLGGTGRELTLPNGSSLTQTGPFSLQIPLPGGGLGGVQDGETFSIDLDPADGIPATQFEFDSDGFTTGGRVVVSFTTLDSADQIADNTILVVRTAFPELHPVKIDGEAAVEINGFTNTVVYTSGNVDMDPARVFGDNRDIVQLRSHLTQTGSAGGVAEGQTFVLTDGFRTVTFELDTDGAANAIGNILIDINVDGFSTNLATTDQLAGAIMTAIENEGLGLTPRNMGDGAIHLGGTPLTQLDTQSSGLTQSGIASPIQDGDTFEVSIGAITTTFEFDFSGGVAIGNEPIVLTIDQTQEEIADAIITELLANVPSMLPGTVPGRPGLIDLNATPNHTLDTSGTPNLALQGLQGGASPRVPVAFAPSVNFLASDIALAIEQAVNVTVPALSLPFDIQASVNQSRLVTLVQTAGLPSDITFTATQFQLGGQPLKMQASNDIVKQDEDLLRMIGHDVVDRGPLGLDERLPGDAFGVFNTRIDDPADPSYGAPRGIDNAHEGVYIDDIIIGFAERGEMVTNATTNSSFVANPLLAPDQVLNGPYQLEIRRSVDFGFMVDSPPRLRLTRSFDTNDRHTEGLTLVAQPGSHTYDGQTFDLSDGVASVTFEYDDISIGDGVAFGNQPVPFQPGDPDYVVARSIRDAINHSAVQAVLPNISAGLSDGTLQGTGNPTTSTSNRINLYGPAHLTVHGVDVVETNDMLFEATETGIEGRNSPAFLGSGTIGDNPREPLQRGLDVDLFRVDLFRSELIRIDVDAEDIGSDLDAILRVFDVAGNELASSNNRAAPGEFAGRDPYLEFTAPTSGAYYVGVSGWGNGSYDPNVESSGVDGSTGFYQLEVTFGASGRADFILFDEPGDSNLRREQGQILLQANRIFDSEEFGILVDAGNRNAGTDSTPHAGPVRALLELNTDNQAPGVVITNNLIVGGLQGGIHFSGETRPAGAQVASVPFGRIVNNTLFGVGGSLVPNLSGDVGILVDDFAAPTILNNIVANFETGIRVVPDGVSEQLTVVGGQIYQGNASTNISGVASEDFAIALSNPDFDNPLRNGPDCETNLQDPNALFVDPRGRNFYLDACSQAIDSSVGSLLDRASLVQVRDPLGIAPSPILAPGSDVTGQKRVDDPTFEPATGFGEDVFVDRGAIDRADFAGPTAKLTNPADNVADGLDLQSDVASLVQLDRSVISASFMFRLVDGVEPADPTDGLGIDDNTVLSDTVTVTRNGQRLVDNVDYSFSYNRTSDTVRLTPLSGIWTPDSIYVISLNNVDRFVMTAPAGDQISDGDQFSIEDLNPRTDRFEFESGYSIQVPATTALAVPEAGGRLGGIRDGETFTVSYDDGTIQRSVTFEFDKDGNFNGGNFRIPFTSFATQDEIAVAMVTALDQADLNLAPVNLGRGKVHLGTTAFHQVIPTAIGSGTSSLVETGVERGVSDGEFFTLDDGQNLVRFEFDSDGVTKPSTIPVPFSPQNTHEEIADFVTAAIRGAIDRGMLDSDGGALAPNHLGDGRIHLGGASSHILRTSLSELSQTGQPGVADAFGLQTRDASLRIQVPAPGPQGIFNGQTFTVDDGVNFTTFEFSSELAQGPLPSGNVRISFRDNESADTVATNLINALSAANINSNPALRPQLVPNPNQDPNQEGLMEAGDPAIGGLPHLWDTSNSNLVQTGSSGGVRDGETFEIALTDGAGNTIRSSTFELDRDGVQTTGNVIIVFNDRSTAEDIANTMVPVLQSAGLNLNPVHTGLGKVDLGASANHQINFNVSPVAIHLTQLGAPGDLAAIPVSYVPSTSFTATEMALEVLAAINDDPRTQVEVDAIPAGGAQIYVDGALNVTGLGSVFDGVAGDLRFVGAIKDLATNDLKPNQLSGETQFSIILGDVALDLGDAMDPALPTVLGSNGAVHVISDDLYLGGQVDAERNGQPSAVATGDDGDTYLDATLLQNLRPIEPAMPPMAFQIPTGLQIPAAGSGQGGIGDGNTLTIGDARRTVTFEFDSDGTVLPTSIPVPLAGGTQAEVADALVTAITDEDLGLSLNAVHAGRGRVVVGITPRDVLDISGTPALTRVAGVTASNGIVPGDTFQITDSLAGATVTFEYDDVGDAFDVVIGNVAIPFTTVSTLDQVADATVAAIRSVTAPQGTLLVGLNPTNLGGGAISIGGEAKHSIDAADSNLSVSGVPPFEIQVPGLGEVVRTPNALLTLHAPLFGGRVIKDGIDENGNPQREFFTVRSGSRQVVFELDMGDGVQPGHTAIPFTVDQTQEDLVDSVVRAIEAATALGITPEETGDGGLRLGAVLYSVDTSASGLTQSNAAPIVLQAPVSGGQGIADGQTFTITKGNGDPVTFEFDNNVVIEPGNVRVSFTLFNTQNDIAEAVANAISNVDSLDLTPESLGDGAVRLRGPRISLDLSTSPSFRQSGLADGQTVAIDDGVRIVTFEFDSDGVTTPGNPVVNIIDSFTLEVPSVGGSEGGIADGDTFSIRNSDLGMNVIFEFDTDGTVETGNQVIDIAGFNTQNDVTNATVAAVNSSGLELVASNAGGGVVLLEGTTPAHSLDTTNSPLLGVGSQPQSQDAIAAAIIAAIENAPLVPPLNPVYLGNGVMDPQAADNQRVDVTNSNLEQFGQRGGILDGQTFTVSDGTKIVKYEFDFDGSVAGGNVAVAVAYNYTLQVPAGGGGEITDRETFAIRDGVGGTEVVFEFDNDGRAVPGNTAISFNTLSSQDEIARTLATTINSLSSPGGAFNVAATDLGGGRVLLELDSTKPGNRLDTSGTENLSQFLTDDVSAAVTNEINGSAFDPALVVTDLRDGRIHVDGPPSHQLDVSSSRLGLLGQFPNGIQALPGSSLRNRDKFILSDGNRIVTFEFDNVDANDGVVDGNVPIPFTGGSTLQEVTDAIVAAVNSQNLELVVTDMGGGLIRFDGDDEDGVSFEGGLIRDVATSLTVVSSVDGLLDAWVDFNQDGDWNDEGEQVFASEPLVAGPNLLDIATPDSAILGSTMARFRVSTAGGLRPTGLAANGEVEDYLVRIITNVGPTVANSIATLYGTTLANVQEDQSQNPVVLDLSSVFADPDITNGNDDHLRLRVTANSNASLVEPVIAGNELSLILQPNQNGSSFITIEAVDQGGLTVSDTFRVDVAPVDDRPFVVGDGLRNVTVNEDAPEMTVDVSFAFDDVDIATNGDRLSFGALPANDNEQLVTASISGSTLSLQFAPDQFGTATITVEAFDSSLPTPLAVTDTFQVQVNPVNDPPTAVDDTATTDENTLLVTLNVLDNDDDIEIPFGDSISVTGFDATSALGAAVNVGSNGVVTYDPRVSSSLQSLKENEDIVDSFTYTISDRSDASDTGTVSITVDGVNDPPVA
ncbi:MAG: GEVED domain-containing protein, partial [Pirellulaceae bacterium]